MRAGGSGATGATRRTPFSGVDSRSGRGYRSPGRIGDGQPAGSSTGASGRGAGIPRHGT